MDLLPCLLPLGTSLRVNDLAVDAEAQAVTVELEAIAPSCPCPSCQQPAERIHSQYRRTVRLTQQQQQFGLGRQSERSPERGVQECDDV